MLRREVATLTAHLGAQLEVQPDPKVLASLIEIRELTDDLIRATALIRQVAVGVRAQARGEELDAASDLAEIAHFATKLAHSVLPAGVKLVVGKGSLKVRGGSVKLTQVLLNLIVNAAQAMSGLGREGKIEVGWEATPAGARLWVTDNGAGITPEVQKKVFDPFFTTRAAGGGTGLGLSICREIVASIGGEISLLSEVGTGTTISLKLAAPIAAVGQTG